MLLPHVDHWNQRRREIYAAYAAACSSSIKAQNYQGRDFVGHLAVFQTDSRQAFMAYLQEQGVSADIHYPLLDTQQKAWKAQAHRVASTGLVESEQLVNRIVSLPCFPTMTDQEVDKVCHCLSSWAG